MNQKKLLILGAGQYGAVAKETAEAMGCFSEIAFLDDHNPLAIGPLEAYAEYQETYACAFVAMGAPALRLAWLEKLACAGFALPVLAHPQSWVSPSAQLGAGVIVEPMAVVQAGAVVETGCLLCAGCVVNHNSVVQAGCQIDCNGVVPARAQVPSGTKVPCGTTFESL